MKKIGLALMLVYGTAALPAHAKKFDALAETPPMGWNSWNTFACDINESMIREMADAMVASGMKDAGYTYVNIDDCWHGERDENGNIQANKERFPSGMEALAEYIHAKGLKIGLYSDAGATTCAGYPGSRGYEYQDARTYASWGIDYLKYDWCDTKNLSPIGAYTTMRDALYKAGRPVVFSICEWGDNKPWEWAADVGHSWRISGDIYPCWDCEYNWGTWSSWGVLKILDMRADLRLRQYSGKGHWNDLDMMEVGAGMSDAQDRSHFSLWAMLNSPLIAGNDLRNMSEETRKILTNQEILALNQDPLGIEAMRYIQAGDLAVFAKPLANQEWAFLFLNRSDRELSYTHDWAYHEVKDDISGHNVNFRQKSFNWRDLWTGGKGTTAEPLVLRLAPHDVTVLRLSPNN